MPYAYAQQKEYQRKWIAKRRADWFAANGPCVKCGSWQDLQLDHIDGSTKVNHRVWSWSEVRRKEELSKCQALCSDCHKAKTFEDRKYTTDEQDAMILDLHKQGMSQRRIAAEVGVPRHIVRARIS